MNSPLAVAILAWPIACAILYALRAAWRALTPKTRNRTRSAR
ncbi:hypothetical protein ACFCYB_00305 [Streptomyces sp. NPDC056309]